MKFSDMLQCVYIAMLKYNFIPISVFRSKNKLIAFVLFNKMTGSVFDVDINPLSSDKTIDFLAKLANVEIAKVSVWNNIKKNYKKNII